MINSFAINLPKFHFTNIIQFVVCTVGIALPNCHNFPAKNP